MKFLRLLIIMQTLTFCGDFKLSAMQPDIEALCMDQADLQVELETVRCSSLAFDMQSPGWEERRDLIRKLNDINLQINQPSRLNKCLLITAQVAAALIGAIVVPEIYFMMNPGLTPNGALPLEHLSNFIRPFLPQ